jgi:hypothetical protein
MILPNLVRDIIQEDIYIGGDTQLIDKDGLRFILIEKNTMDSFDESVYFVFKYIYNKSHVYLYQLNTEEEMMEFYEKCLSDGFQRRPNPYDTVQENVMNYLPKWIEDLQKNVMFKSQYIYKNYLDDKTKWYNGLCRVELKN